MAILESIVTNGFGGLLANLATEYLKRKNRQLSVDEAQLKTDLSNNLEVAFQKCTKIKTIINDKPVDFLSIYVDQNFQCDSRTIDQFDLIDRIRDGESYIVTGTGGGGKSMFMRYLWLSYFEKSEGKIPFFLELRHLNTLTHSKIEDFIYHTIIQSRSNISQKNFISALNHGEFILFFDGFDEISLDMRDKVESWIIALKENNPKLTIVMTSRPMDRFRGWAGFNVTQVLPLSENQVSQLIDRAPFFSEDKKKLQVKIKQGLYKSHREFLSNPLLAYMMLVTISCNPDIPSKMHLFYEMAFEALFHRHDLTKNGFKREFHSKIEKQEFIKILAYFSLLTYHAECYEFSIEEFRAFMAKVRAIEAVKFDDDAYLRDLMESLCLIKLEGLEYSFTHRSFQEYFSAYCIARVASRNIEKIFNTFARRHSDHVLQMVYEMNVNLFREKYILPLHEKYKTFFSARSTADEPQKMLNLRNGEFRVVRRSPPSKRINTDGNFIILTCDGEFDSLVLNVSRLTDLDARRRIAGGKGRQADDRFVSSHLPRPGHEEDDTNGTISSDGAQFIFRNMTGPNIDDDFRQTGMYEFLVYQARNLKRFINGERIEFERLKNSFDDLF